MARLRTIVILFTILVFRAMPAFGFAGGIGIFDNPYLGDCRILNGPDLTSVYVVHYGSDGTVGSSFSAPIPPCWSGAVYVGDIVQFQPYVGDTQNGINVTYGACVEGNIHVATILVIAPAVTEVCCGYPVRPHPLSESGQIESTNCAQTIEFAGEGCGVISVDPDACPCDMGCPRSILNPFPPSGAHSVPTDVILSWDPPNFAGPAPPYDVYLGIDPTPPLVASDLAQPNLPTGALQPNTTYYWRVEGCNAEIPQLGECAYGGVWSFTTEGPVDTRPRSWGSIKELFRVNGI